MRKRSRVHHMGRLNLPTLLGDRMTMRKPMNLCIDPCVRASARDLARSLGTSVARLADVALRAELGRHGVVVAPSSPVDEAIERAIAARRCATEGA